MAAHINKRDSKFDKLSKILPADVTATFLSVKSGLVIYIGSTTGDAAPIFYSFLALLVLCPLYFWFVAGVKNHIHNAFLCLSFIVFAMSIASSQFGVFALRFEFGDQINEFLPILNTVLPIFWVSIISPIFLAVIDLTTEMES